MVTEKIYNFEPDFVVIPGDTLLETIESIGISQAELAKRTGRPLKTINGIIKGNVAITPETALQLEKVLRVPANFWINLESNYRQALARQREKDELSNKIEWLEKFPVNEIVKLGFIKKAKDKTEQLKELLKFFGVASIESWEEVWETNVAFRKSEAFKTDYNSIAAWVRMVEIQAQQLECKPYDKEKFKNAIDEIRGITKEVNPDIFIPEVKRICAEAGVAVVFIPELRGCRASGVTKWINSDKAVIGLSLRYKSNDHLWFTFFHEAGHIILHGKKLTFLEGVNDETNKQKEEEADTFATNKLIPKAKYLELLSSGQFSYASVKAFSDEIGIAPGIVVGRLQHDRIIPFTHLNKLKQRYTWK